MKREKGDSHIRATVLALLALVPALAASSGGALGPVAMDAYTQTLVVTFKSEEAAARARVWIAPLYHDLRAACSTRMDDCDLNDLRVAELMAQYGQKGTFYLNQPWYWYQDSPATGLVTPPHPEVEVVRRLLAGGNSLGDHTISHEVLPAVTRNLAFKEIMGVRAILETQGASPVISFVYPCGVFHSVFRDGRDRADIEEMLRRAGIYQVAEHRYNEGWDSRLQDGVFIVQDGGSKGGLYSEAVLTQPRSEDDRPLFLVTMHAWVKEWGGPDYPKLTEIYRRWGDRPDWWYCNHNEYAAYRYQARHSQMTAFVEGRTIRAVLTRPDPLDLGDGTPLTLKVEGVGADEVASAACPGAEVKPVALGGGAAFDLFHDRGRDVIERFAVTDNPTNSEQWDQAGAAVEGLRALLFRRGNILTLRLRNEGPAAVEDVRVVFRLPLRWEEGVIRRRVGPLAGGAEATVEVVLTERADAGDYTVGAEYDAAQVDFRGARRARVYATVEEPEKELPAYYARNGFWMLGPLAGDVAGFDPLAFAQPFLEGAPPAREYDVPWGGRVAWRAFNPARAAALDPDLIPTAGIAYPVDAATWETAVYFPHANAHYVFYGRLVSPDDRTVKVVFPRVCVKRLYANGRPVAGDTLELKKGVNDLRLLYAPRPEIKPLLRVNSHGCYFRLVDAAGARVTDVRFERPPPP